MDALLSMHTYLSTRPLSFPSVIDGIGWQYVMKLLWECVPPHIKLGAVYDRGRSVIRRRHVCRCPHSSGRVLKIRRNLPGLGGLT